jgi:hypothetical protein
MAWQLEGIKRHHWCHFLWGDFLSTQRISLATGSHIFEVCTLEIQTSLALGFPRSLLPSLCYSDASIAFWAVLMLTRGFNLNRSRAFWFGLSACLPKRISLVWLTPFWHSSCGFLSLELFITDQQCLYAPRIKGVDSPRLPHSGGSYCFDLRVVGFNPSNCPLAGNALLLFRSWLSIPWPFLHFGLQCLKFTRIMTSFIQTTWTVIASYHGLQSPSYF